VNLNGSSTGFDNFYISDKRQKWDKILFSYIGYKNSIVGYTGQKSLNVLLEEEIS
jgi:iron complex outermembrane receptor protein